MPERRLTALLRALADAGVEFIVVGGLAAVLDGAPLTTFDVDIVHARNEANIARLLSVLDAIDAIFRIQPERRLRPTAAHLAGTGHLNLITRHGPLDILGAIGDGLTSDDLLPRSTLTHIGAGLQIRVLDLPTLIALKEASTSEKDRAVLPILRRTLAEKNSLRPPA